MAEAQAVIRVVVGLEGSQLRRAQGGPNTATVLGPEIDLLKGFPDRRRWALEGDVEQLHDICMRIRSRPWLGMFTLCMRPNELQQTGLVIVQDEGMQQSVLAKLKQLVRALHGMMEEYGPYFDGSLAMWRAAGPPFDVRVLDDLRRGQRREGDEDA